jgi:ubiquinone/menaquinone biosynthesis C-methylase UbiE
MFERIYYWLHSRASKPQERGEYSSGVWQNMIRAETLKLIAGSGGKILELGCGEGLFLQQLSQSNPGLELWGVDNSSSRIEQAEKRLAGKNCQVSVQDAANLSFEDGFFDRVVCINVFFNMPSLEMVKKTLLQMKRVSKSDGRLVFDFRNSANPLLGLKYKLAPFYDRTVKDLPLKTYSLKVIAELLQDLDLKVVSLNYLGASFKKLAPIIMVEVQK